MIDRPLSRKLVWVILFAAVFAALGRLLTCDFTWWDDPATIHHNWRFNPVNWDSFVFYWRYPAEDIYIPLTRNAWALVALVAQVSANPDGIALNPMMYHGLSLVTHLCGAYAVFALFRRLLRHDLAALLGAIFWAVHPVQVESVGWVSGYKDVLSGTLLLVSMERYAAWRQMAGRERYSASLVIFVLAMLAKPAAMTLPLLLAALDYLAFRRSWREIAAALWPFALAAVPIMLIARLVQPALMTHSPFWARPLVAADSVAFYITKILLPLRLTVDYGRSPLAIIRSGVIWYSWLLPAAIGGLVAWSYRRARRAGRPIDLVPALGIAFFVLAPLHVIGLVPFDFQSMSTVADHYLYVALLGPALCLAWAAMKLPRSFYIAASIAIVAYGTRSAFQTSTWENETALMTHIISVNPDSAVAYINLAGDYHRAGDYTAELHSLEHAQRLDPDSPLINLGFADLYLDLGNEAMAEQNLQSYIQKFIDYYGMTPSVIPAYQKAIDRCWLAYRLDNAERFIDEGLSHFPNNPYLNFRKQQVGLMRNDPRFRAIPSTMPATPKPLTPIPQTGPLQ